MAEVLAWLLGFLTRDVDRKSAARDWRLALLAAAILAGAGAALWRFPDPSELVSRRVPAMVCLALGAVFLAYGVFVHLRQRPATLPADRIAIGIARLHPVGGGRAGELAEVEAEKLYRQLNARQKAGAPIHVRRVFASISEAETDEARAESARELGMQPNIRVHLVVWGDAVAEGPGRLYLSLAAAHPVLPAQIGDASSEEYEALAAEYPDLSYADFVLLRCGEALVAAKEDTRALAVTCPVQSVASAVLRGEAHLRLSRHQPPEVCKDHLQRAVAEFERLTGAEPEPTSFQPCSKHRGHGEWSACFSRLKALARLARDQDAEKYVRTLLRLKDAHRSALAQAEKVGADTCDAALDWWEGYALTLGVIHSTDRTMSIEFLRESLTIHEWVVREHARRGHAENLLLTATYHFLRHTVYSVGEGLKESVLDAADRCVRDVAAGAASELAATLLDFALVMIDLRRLGSDTAEQQRARIQASIAASGRLLANERVKNDLALRKGVLFTLASSREKLALSYPVGPDRQAGLLASVSAWQSWSQVPSKCTIGVDAETMHLGGAYLTVAVSGSSSPSDAVQFAQLAQQIYEALLRDPFVGPEDSTRPAINLNLSIALWVLARYSLSGRESLLASAREHADRAADRGVDTTWIGRQLDALAAEVAGARPAVAAAVT